MSAKRNPKKRRFKTRTKNITANWSKKDISSKKNFKLVRSIRGPRRPGKDQHTACRNSTEDSRQPSFLLPDLHELRLHIRQLSWRRARHLCAFLVCVFVILETCWVSSTFSSSVVEISSVLLVTVCSRTRIVHETCWAGPHMWTGLTVVRDLQLGSCCQRDMLWCGSQLWIVHWLSPLVFCITSRLQFLL